MFVLPLASVGRYSHALESLTAYTEEYPPYSFVKDGKPSGIATEMLQDVCRLAAISCKIEIVPWARAYHSALNTPNTLVFSTSRTPAREMSFLWIGPIQPRRVELYVRSGASIRISRASDLNGFRVGVVNGDSVAEELRSAGVDGQYLELAPTLESNVRKLLAGRIDVLPAVAPGMEWSLREMNLDADVVEPVFSYSSYDLYFALNRGSDPETVKALRKAWARMGATKWRDFFSILP